MKNKTGLYLIGALLISGGALIGLNWEDIFDANPRPVIVDSDANADFTGILNFTVKVSGTVINQGGDGPVDIEASVYQGDKRYREIETVYMRRDEVQSFEIEISKAKMEEWKYSVDAYPTGSKEYFD